MFKNKPILKYNSLIDVYEDNPKPIRSMIPDWYKDSPKWINGNIANYPNGGVASTFKQCTPFLDAFTTGYAITLPYDLIVVNRDGAPWITWKYEEGQPVRLRNNEDNPSLPIPVGHSKQHFAWVVPVTFEVPKGYSILVTHPLNRFELPFTTISGIIDGDFPMPLFSNLPFFIHQGFEGIIPQGTPIAQLVPFKLQTWKSEKDSSLIEKAKKEQEKASLTINGLYKSLFWNKKRYL
jgi:hypothetical protein